MFKKILSLLSLIFCLLSMILIIANLSTVIATGTIPPILIISVICSIICFIFGKYRFVTHFQNK